MMKAYSTQSRTLSKSPHGPGFLSARVKVFAAYELYEASAPDVQALGVETLNAIQSAALINSYEGPTIPMKVLRENLTKPILTFRCLHCSISEPDTLDHYLPKKTHPHFSTYSKNLFPACTNCNRRKMEKVVDDNTDVRRFLHPYYDDIPNEKFLTIRMQINPREFIISFDVIQATGMSDDVFQHLKSHFDELLLASRYRKNALIHLRENRKYFLRTYGEDHNAPRLSAELLKTSEDFESDYGPNYWMSVLYRGLSENAEFCAGGFSTLSVVQ